MRLWHDDTRPAPAGWVWARTNAQAKELLMAGTCEEISLDHDLGLNELGIDELEDWDKLIELTYALAETIVEETGVDLVEWMLEQECVPPKVTVHSWNPQGAMRIAQRLADNGHEVVLRPFDPKERR